VNLGPSTIELQRMRLDAEALMPSTCTTQVRSTTSDGQGGVTETWTDTDDVPCRLAPMGLGNRSSSEGDRFVVHEAYILSVHWDRSIAPGNRVVFDSDTYEVLSVDDDHDYRVARRAVVQKVMG